MNPDVLGLVMAGAGARGAYEAGALAEALRRQPEDRPQVLVGTSAGSINVLLTASLAHLPASEAADVLDERWRTADRDMVIAPILPSGLLTAGRYLAAVGGGRLAAALHLRRPRLPSLLDNSPLRRTAADPAYVDWERLHRNVDDGLVRAVAVVATRLPDGRSVVFVECAPDVALPPNDDRRGIDYVRTRLGPEHMLASCAIPAAFPAERVRVHGQHHWYVDGGTRLNTPIKPALALEADRLLVVATDPPTRPVRPERAGPQPDVVDSIAQFAHTVLADRMVEDLATLVSFNRAAPPQEQSASDGVLKRIRKVRYRFLGPLEDDVIPHAVHRVYARRYGRLAQRLARPDFPILSALIDGSGPSHDDLLSYLFFDQAFLAELVELGRADAAQRLGGPEWLDTTLPA